MINLFELVDEKVVPSVHCTTLRFLRDIRKNHPDNYLRIYEYLFYMTCPNQKLNPYFNMDEGEREESILEELTIDFDLEEKDIQEALKKCEAMYETPSMRAVRGAKAMLDRLTSYLETAIIDGSAQKGNGAFINNTMKNLSLYRKAYSEAVKDLDEEQGRLRGDSYSSYDEGE